MRGWRWTIRSVWYVMGCNGRMGKVPLRPSPTPRAWWWARRRWNDLSAVMGLDAGELNGLGRLGVAISDSLEKVKDDFDPSSTSPVPR